MISPNRRAALLVTMMTALVFIVAPTAAFAQIEEVQQQNVTDNNTSLNAATATTTTAGNVTAITPAIELGEEPFAVGRYTPVSETMINETQQLQIILEGSTRITLPNTTETITTRDTGEAIITFLPGGGVIRGQLQLTTEDGSETVTVDVTEYFLSEAPTAISLVYLSTNSTGMLAPLNNMIAVSLDEEQTNGDVIARLFEWKYGTVGGGGNHTSAK